MKMRKVLLCAVVCMMTACQLLETNSQPTAAGEIEDSAAIYQDWTYREMFNGSLAKAETYASRAFLLSRDSIQERNTLSLLCYIYYREGKQQQLELLMKSISPEMYMNVMSVQSQVEQAKAGRQQTALALVIILLLLLLGGLGTWYVRRIKALSRLYQQRITAARQELREEMQRLTESPLVADMDLDSTQKLDINETKKGIDVLFAIINDQNISQMGKNEEQAVMKILPMVDRMLADALGKAPSPLTPKETFFCIMEYYGKNDHQKARSFCCSEQAVRSTKSRLNKKMNVSLLHLE